MRAHRQLAILGLVLAGFALALSVPPLVPPTTDPPCVFHAPILCAELPPDGAALGAVLADPRNPLPRWRSQVLLDFPFLALYATLLGGAFRLADRRGLAFAALVALGASLDVAENIGILLAVDDVARGDVPSDALAAWTRSCASAKFVALAIGVTGGCALVASRSTHVAARLLFGAVAFVASVGLVGPFAPVGYEVGLLGIVLASTTLWGRSIALSRRPAS